MSNMSVLVCVALFLSVYGLAGRTLHGGVLEAMEALFDHPITGGSPTSGKVGILVGLVCPCPCRTENVHNVCGNFLYVMQFFSVAYDFFISTLLSKSISLFRLLW